MTDIYR